MAVLVFPGEQVQRAEVAARAVLTGHVVTELVGADFGEEVGAAVEGLGVEELAFDGVVDALDVGIGVGTGGRVEAMPGSVPLLDGEMEALGPVIDGAAIELRSQVGGDDDLGGVQAWLLRCWRKRSAAKGA